MYENQIDDADVVVADPTNPEDIQKVINTYAAQKKHWREKALDQKTGKTFKEMYEELAKENESLKKPAETPKPTETAKPERPVADPDWVFDNIDALTSLSGEERSELRNTARELGIEPIKFIKSKAGQAQLKELRSQKKTEEATPSSSASVPQFKGKPISNILLDDSAKREDKQAAYEEMMKARRTKNQSI